MGEYINKIFNREREFDEIIEEVLFIAEHEKNKDQRREKILHLTAKVKRAYLAAHYDAITDSLTGCFNKKHIKEMFHHQYSLAKRNNQYFSLVAMDIDYLKYINDTYGHNKGDEVIKNVIRVVSKIVRDEDLVFRYGGDEFILFCIHNNKLGIKKISARIKKEVSSLKTVKGHKPAVTIGYATVKTNGGDNVGYAALFQEADEMLYEEKHKRKPPAFLKNIKSRQY